MAAADNQKHRKTNIFWKKDPDPESGIVKIHAPAVGVNFDVPTIKKPMVKMPVYIRKPRVVNLSRSCGAQSSAQLLRKKLKDIDEIDIVPTRDTGTSSLKTTVVNEKKTITLKDLSTEDKQRVANLVRELAKVGEERELALTQLKEERVAFEERLEILQHEYDSVTKEKEYMKNRFVELQTLLKKYKSSEKENRRPSHPVKNKVETEEMTSPGGTRKSELKGSSRPSLGGKSAAACQSASLVHESENTTKVPPVLDSIPTPIVKSGKADRGSVQNSPPTNFISKTKPDDLCSDLQNVGVTKLSKLGQDCSPTPTVQTRVTSRPQTTSSGYYQPTETRNESLSSVSQYYPLESVPDSSQNTTAGVLNITGQQTAPPETFQTKFMSPAYSSRMFDQNIAQDSRRTLPCNSVDRSQSDSTISQAVSAELDAVYRLHCREYELQLQLQQQQLELQRQQLQLQQQLQQFELFQHQNKLPPDTGTARIQDDAVPSYGDLPLSGQAPRPSSKPHQISPTLSLVPTPDAQEVTEEKFSQDPTKQTGDTSRTTPNMLSDHNTRVRSVEIYQNSGETANLYQRNNEDSQENVCTTEYENNPSRNLRSISGYSRLGERQSINGYPSGCMTSQMPELIEETFLDSRNSSRTVAPHFGTSYCTSQASLKDLAEESSKFQSQSTVTLHGNESTQAHMVTAADQAAHFRTGQAQRDIESTQAYIATAADQIVYINKGLSQRSESRSSVVPTGYENNQAHTVATDDQAGLFATRQTGRVQSRLSVNSTSYQKGHMETAAHLPGQIFTKLDDKNQSRPSILLPGCKGMQEGPAALVDQPAFYAATHGDNTRADSRMSVLSTSTMQEHDIKRGYSLYQDPKIAVSGNTLNRQRTTTSVSASFSQETNPPENHSCYETHTTPNITDPSRENREVQRLHMLARDSFRAPRDKLPENQHLLHPISSSGDLDAIQIMDQNRCQIFTTSSESDSSFCAKNRNYPPSLVNIVQEIEQSRDHPQFEQHHDTRQSSSIYGHNENLTGQHHVEYYLNDEKRHLACKFTDSKLKGNSIPVPIERHEKELGSNLSSLLDNNERRNERLPSYVREDITSPLHCTARRPTTDRIFGIVGTDNSGYSQESYRDRSPLNSNREDLDPEQEEADVLNEIFFASYRRR